MKKICALVFLFASHSVFCMDANTQTKKDLDLISACVLGKTIDVKPLLNGVNLNGANHLGWTLLIAASTSQISPRTKVQALLAAKADPKILSPNGYSPLMLAASQNSLEGVTILLAAGADKGVKNYHGRTAFDYTRDNTIEALLQADK